MAMKWPLGFRKCTSVYFPSLIGTSCTLEVMGYSVAGVVVQVQYSLMAHAGRHGLFPEDDISLPMNMFLHSCPSVLHISRKTSYPCPPYVWNLQQGSSSPKNTLSFILFSLSSRSPRSLRSFSLFITYHKMQTKKMFPTR